MATQKILARSSLRVCEQLYVIIARRPSVHEQLARSLFKGERRVVSQEIERLSEWSAPCLIPSLLRARLASAIATPTTHAMRAAPCRAKAVRPKLSLHLHRRRVIIQKLAVVRDTESALAGFDFERIDERAITPVKMVPVGLAVRSDIDAAIRAARRARETINESLARSQRAVKRYRLGD